MEKEPSLGENVREMASLGIDAFAGVDEGHASAINLRDHRLVHSAVSGVYPDLAKA